MTDKQFYLGRLFDTLTNQVTNQVVSYDPADLTTHAVVTGMTGSGKTGLCIGLLEEAALQGIPAIIIDPKGDLTNLLLHFPDLVPSDFQPWIDPDLARRAGETLEQAAHRGLLRLAQRIGAVGRCPRAHPRPQERRQFCDLHPRLRRWHPGQCALLSGRAETRLELE